MLTFQEWLVNESVVLNMIQNKYEKAMKLFLYLKDKGEDVKHAMRSAAGSVGIRDREFHDYLWDKGYKI